MQVVDDVPGSKEQSHIHYGRYRNLAVGPDRNLKDRRL